MWRSQIKTSLYLSREKSEVGSQRQERSKEDKSKSAKYQHAEGVDETDTVGVLLQK